MKTAKGKDLLEGLIRERGSYLINYASVVSGDSAQAHDLVQEAMVRVLSRTRLNAETIHNVEAYVKTVIVKLFIDDIRRRRRWTERKSFTLGPDAGYTHAPGIEVCQDIATALKSISAQQRVALIRYYFDDQPIAVIAKEMNCSEGNVKRHLSDARTRLATSLPGYEEGVLS